MLDPTTRATFARDIQTIRDVARRDGRDAVWLCNALHHEGLRQVEYEAAVGRVAAQVTTIVQPDERRRACDLLRRVGDDPAMLSGSHGYWAAAEALRGLGVTGIALNHADLVLIADRADVVNVRRAA